MNERIKELEERCWEELGEEEAMYPVFNTEKFAKLIVKECLDILDDLQEWPSTEPKHCANEIEKHFGVTE